MIGDSGVSSPGPSSEASLSSQKNCDVSYMDRVVSEVIESEAVYVRDLHQVVQVRLEIFLPFFFVYKIIFIVVSHVAHEIVFKITIKHLMGRKIQFLSSKKKRIKSSINAIHHLMTNLIELKIIEKKKI